MNTCRQFLLSFCFLLFAGNVSAQKTLQEYDHLSVGYGLINNIKSHNRPGKYIGPFYATYQLPLGKRFTMGFGLGCAFGKTYPFTYTYTDKSGNKIIVDNEVLRYSSYMVTVRTDFHYLKKEKIDLYSGIYLDMARTMRKPQFVSWLGGGLFELAASLNLLGCRYLVTPRISAYGEIGLNFKQHGIVGVSTILGKIEKKDKPTQKQKE